MKTNKQKQADYRQRQKEKGLVELRGIWVKPDQTEKVKEFIKTINHSPQSGH